MRIEPAVSVPSVPAARSAAAAAPLPPLEPPQMRSATHGFRAGPKCGLVVSRAEGELVRVQLPEHDRARGAQPRDDRGVARGDVVAEDLGRRRRRARRRRRSRP